MSAQRSTTDPQPTTWTGSTTDADQPRFPVRLAVGLAVGAFCWIVAYLGAVGVLLPARVAEIAPDDKAAIIALNSTVSMIVATLANITIGASSDLTRSRFGRRTPWIWVGAIGSLGSLFVLGRVTTAGTLIAAWAVYQVFLNAIIAPLLGTLSDRVAPRYRGTAASAYALGIGVGTGLGQVIGAQFLGSTATGFLVLGVLTFVAGPAAALFFREASSIPMPAKPFTKDLVLDNFVFARRDARDYYLALFGKFFIMLAKFSIQGYMLYILTDYMLLEKADAARYISLTATIIMVAGITMAFVAGPLADRLGRIKLPVVISSLLIGAGVLVPFFSPSPSTIVAYAVLAGIGFGAFNAVDQALNISVLPNPATAAKDLGILNLSNTGGQIAGPLLAAAVITASGGYRLLFVLAAGSALVGAALFTAVRRVR
ncbi:MFS transporter [Cellulomonas sp. HD19AZ1]|uniref:MFS transporter n=1 Tax=Cellulomonas TaxID=1707 RepID=UPI0010707FB6|nr:MFS transporter [Cellulomonas sp. HD19AZ1]TFH71069.1 MFS transporter [Cellulomonas sp. HD19AZ1]